MKQFTSFLFICILLLLGVAPAAQAQTGDWEPVVQGAIDFQVFQAPGPNEVFVTRMHRENPDVFIDSSLGQGRLTGGTETVSNMAKRYDQAINYWGETWGGRNQVLVGINGFFYGPDEEPPGVPWSGQIQSGWYAKRFDDWGSGFDWRLDRTAFVGRCVNHRPDKQFVTHVPTNGTVEINGINEDRGGDDLILFTPQYDISTGTDNSGLELLVELERPTLIIPAPSSGSRYVNGTVRAVLFDQGNTLIPFDHVVISAKGSARGTLESFDIEPGDQIGINQEITHYEVDCVDLAPSEVGWTKSYASIGGYPIVLRAGEIPDFEAEGVDSWEVINPRTAIALNDEFIYFIVVDGRNPGVSVGMNYPELGAFALDILGADWAINQDGGGSSTMWITGHVVNNTYCNNSNCLNGERAEGDGNRQPRLFFLNPDSNNVFMPMIRRAPVVQRQVANGMLMIVYEPIDLSTSFVPAENILTVVPTELRLGPGTNYASLTTLPANSEGQVIAHNNGLDGVRAKGSFWWKVNFNGAVGWVVEESLIPFNWLSEARFETRTLPSLFNLLED